MRAKGADEEHVYNKRGADCILATDARPNITGIPPRGCDGTQPGIARNKLGIVYWASLCRLEGTRVFLQGEKTGARVGGGGGHGANAGLSFNSIENMISRCRACARRNNEIK